MTQLSELTASEGVELALTILLEYGWVDSYYTDWKAYAGDNYDEEVDNYSITELNGAWEAFMNYTKKTASNGELTAEFIATQSDGTAHDSEVYFVVLGLSDGVQTRYFKRNGWYASYDGGHLEEGLDSEVFPRSVSLTVYDGGS